jgi:hypothetical protein
MTRNIAMGSLCTYNFADLIITRKTKNVNLMHKVNTSVCYLNVRYAITIDSRNLVIKHFKLAHKYVSSQKFIVKIIRSVGKKKAITKLQCEFCA